MTPRAKGQAGETLIEILMAIVIMGITATGLIAGLSAGVFASDAHRRLSAGESVLRTYGELVKNKILHPPATVSTADIGPFTKNDVLTIPVESTTAFTNTPPYTFTDPLPYTVAFDGDLVTVTSKTSTSFTGTVLASGLVRRGAVVQRYVSCPNADYFADLLTKNPELTTGERLGPPGVTPPITFYDSNNAVVTCSTFHSDPGKSSCSLSGDWRTDCDPPWMRVSVKLVSTDVGRSRASLTTDIIVRRVA